MNCERSLIAAFVFLVLGLGFIFGYTHGTVGFGAAYPVAGTSLQVSINTTGLPALTGAVSTILGVVFLLVALVQAIVAQMHWPGEKVRAASPAK